MYLEYFGFQRLPFTIAPDPELLYPTHSHQEALAHLHYALSGHGGLVCLTGEVGTGKTTLCRAFLSALPAHVRSAYIFNPQLSDTGLLQSLCEELGIPVAATDDQRALYSRLNQALLQGYAAGQRFVCIIDEAQSMPVALMEQVRLLTNLETDQEKLLTLILVGQPELRQMLARHDLRQLSQRITARYHLPHLGLADTSAYLRFRCRQAGVSQPLFSALAVWTLWRTSRGIPRLLNSLADRALLGAYARGRRRVGWALIRGAAAEVLPPVTFTFSRRWRWLPVWLLIAAALGLWQSGLAARYQPGWLSGWLAASPQRQLLEAHGVQGHASCETLAATGWQCLNLSWPQERLTELPGPALLRVLASDGEQWLMRAAFQAAEHDYQGESLVLWQPPSAYRGQLIRPGERSELVAWVRTQLGMDWPADWQVIAPSGQPDSGPDPLWYDPLLARKVAEFQQAHGLRADRILGPHTLFMLWQQERG